MQISKQAERIIRNTRALYYAAKHPGVSPWVKGVISFMLLYVLSPVDLIPDFIPAVGYLDELLLVPLVTWCVVRLIPAGIWRDCLRRAAGN